MPDFDFGDEPKTFSQVLSEDSIKRNRVEHGSQQQPTSSPGWFVASFINSLVCCLAGIFIGYAAANVSWPDITPNPSPLRDGTYVLFLVEDDDVKNWPREQQQIRTALPLRKWADDHCTIEKMEDGTEAAAMRWFDVDADLENESDEWRKLRKSVTLDPPSAIVSHGGRAKEFKLPKDTESTLKALEAVVK